MKTKLTCFIFMAWSLTFPSHALSNEDSELLNDIVLNVDIRSEKPVLNNVGAPVSKIELCQLWGSEFVQGKGPWGLGFASDILCQSNSTPGAWTLRIEDAPNDMLRIILARTIANSGVSEKDSSTPEIQETALETPSKEWLYGGADKRFLRLVAAAILEDSPIVAKCNGDEIETCGKRIENSEFFSFAPRYPGTFEPFAIRVARLTGTFTPLTPEKSQPQWMVTTSERAQNRERFLDATHRAVAQMRTEMENRSIWKPQVVRKNDSKNWFKKMQPRAWFDVTQSLVSFDSPSFKGATNTYIGGDVEIIPGLRLGPENRTRSFEFDVNTKVRYMDQEVAGTVNVKRKESALGAHADIRFGLNENIEVGMNASLAESYGTLEISASNNLPRSVLPDDYKTWGLSSNCGANAFWKINSFVSMGPYVEANYLKTPDTWSLGADLRAHIAFQTLSKFGENGLVVEGIVLTGVGLLDENLKGTRNGHPFSLSLGASNVRAGLGLSLRLP